MPEKDGQARRLAGDPLAGLDADRLKGLLGDAWNRPPAPTPEERAAGREGGRRAAPARAMETELLPAESEPVEDVVEVGDLGELCDGGHDAPDCADHRPAYGSFQGDVPGWVGVGGGVVG